MRIITANRDALIDAIKFRRKELKLSQDKLAEQLGIAATTIKRFEIGKTNVRLDTLVEILDYLGIKMVAIWPSKNLPNVLEQFHDDVLEKLDA